MSLYLMDMPLLSLKQLLLQLFVLDFKAHELKMGDFELLVEIYHLTIQLFVLLAQTPVGGSQLDHHILAASQLYCCLP